MTSYSGSVAYLEYVANSTKGGVAQGKRLNGVFDLGDTSIDPRDRMLYTSQAVVEARTAAAGATFSQTVAWYPIAKAYNAGDNTFGDYEIKFLDSTGAAISDVTYTVTDEKTIAVTAGGTNVAKIAYKYNQEHIPANDIPFIGPKMKSIPLIAEPRRIAVKYDQITAFQAKTDYGFSLDKQIAEQACGELAY